MIDNCLRQGALNTSNTSRQTKSGAEANRNRSTTHYGRVNRSVLLVHLLKPFYDRDEDTQISY